MSFSVYEIVIPPLSHGLHVLDDYLDHARRWELENARNEGSALMERLAPDMLSLGEQFSVTCDKVDAHIARLKQEEPQQVRATAKTYQGLRERLMSTLREVEGVTPDSIANAQSHTYALNPPIVRGWFGGDDYIRHLVLPDFFFHVAMVHAILRHLGAAVGKRNFLGNLSMQSGGDYS